MTRTGPSRSVQGVCADGAGLQDHAPEPGAERLPRVATGAEQQRRGRELQLDIYGVALDSIWFADERGLRSGGITRVPGRRARRDGRGPEAIVSARSWTTGRRRPVRTRAPRPRHMNGARRRPQSEGSAARGALEAAVRPATCIAPEAEAVDSADSSEGGCPLGSLPGAGRRLAYRGGNRSPRRPGGVA